ncbi:MAG: polysaccharide biosynthesis protein [Prevotellaceae bacterium]|jgi:mannosyltransferase OCH1-like enzyme|nr:polysaccharide biosynthesis protein [Prevotellaceae bacterium]
MAIPKKIHWCWLSGEPLPKNLQKCVNSWQRIMPDYEIILWDKQRFDIHSVKFVEDACAARKWAFAADYIRVYALYTEGGIYLDSDVKVFRRFDKFLHNAAFSSIEHHVGVKAWTNSEKYGSSYNAIQAAVIGAEKNHNWIKMCMEHYHKTTFSLREDGSVNVDTSPDIFAHYAHINYGFKYDEHYNKMQKLEDGIVIYPQKVFASAFSGATLNSYALHLCNKSWLKTQNSLLYKIDTKLCTNSRFFAMLHYKIKQLLRKIFPNII